MLHCSVAAGEVVLICHGSLTFVVVVVVVAVEHQLQTAFSSISIDVGDQICKEDECVEQERYEQGRASFVEEVQDERLTMMVTKAQRCVVCVSFHFHCIASIHGHEENRVKRRREEES